MAHGYRTLQHWNQWLTQQFLGANLLEAEQKVLLQMLEKHFGKHALLIGVPRQHELLQATSLPCHTLISPLIYHEKKVNYIEGDFHELPIHTGSIDVVLLPHTLEFMDNPRQLLSEACRVIKPEGLIVISGFNPLSSWGARKVFSKRKPLPWGGSFIPINKVKRWLQLVDFAIEQQKSILYRPPLANRTFYQKLFFLEYIGSKFFPMSGGVYILVARAKVIPLTPIRLKWKQELSGLRISTTISGPC